MKKLWTSIGLEDYAKEHTIKECAEMFKCSYIAMQHYLLRHNIKHKLAEKGVKGEKHGQYKHGQTPKRLYKIWTSMRLRCNNQNCKDFVRYGARGIKVCKAWDNFADFRAWSLSHGYSETLTLDRIDNDKGYSPDNCRWVTIKEQGNNRRTNRLVTYKGETLTVAQWADKLGMERHALLYRLDNWTIEDALTKKLQRS